MSTCFISDLHLNNHHPAVLDRFHTFLQHEAVHHQTLYILGDLFDGWLGDDISGEAHQATLEALRKTAEHGVSIYVQHGNRDFAMRSRFERESGCRLIRDPHTVKLDGIPVLLTHGDQLCSDDHEYQRYRSIVRHPVVEWVMIHLPRRTRIAIGRRLKQQSGRNKQQKSDTIMDVNQQMVERTMRNRGVLHMVHGHTHRPAAHHFTLDGEVAERWVLGDWDRTDDRDNILIYRDHRFHWLRV